MTESRSHKSAKNKAAGKKGKTEVPLKGNRRLDAATSIKAVEVERSGSSRGLEKAAKRLKDSGKSQKVLQVPNKDIGAATQAMRKVGVSGSVKNMSGTKRTSVKASKTNSTGPKKNR